MKNFLLLVLVAGSLLAQDKKNAVNLIPWFPLEQNDLELARPAEPLQYFDKVGMRAALMGLEGGSFEAWVWPWKPLRNFELSFLTGKSTQPVLARDIVRTIAVTPEQTTITYTDEAFSVKETILVPRAEPGMILLLDVHTTVPLTIVSSFLPVMQPMWPAGLGGQFSYWDDDARAYVISEGQWRAIFLCGSPAGEQMAAPPAHMFSENPLQFRIDVKPGESDGQYIPIVIAGAVPDRQSSRMSMDSVKATYGRLWKHADEYYRQNVGYYRDLRASTLSVITPRRDLNLAYEWGKVALDNLMVVNPRLGEGLVAGYGLSGGGERPGFAWFFGGDAFVNSLAFTSFGAFRTTRDALAFTQKWQRQEDYPVRRKSPRDVNEDVGKMSHELSQSEGLCDWWNDYHYGYNHAETTSWYIVSLGDYVRRSGDVQFLRESWKSVKQAYEWDLRKDSDHDGLMDLKGAGLGVLEFGKLVGIYADAYTCGLWLQAIKEVEAMSALMADEPMRLKAEAQYRKALPEFERKFWGEDVGFYSYGATEKGEQVKEKTPWPVIAMTFGLVDEARTVRTLAALGGADMLTDWGVRSLASSSSLFDPVSYNYGAVWPFISCYFTTAQYRHHFSTAAYQTLSATVNHAFDYALGSVPEVFSGEMNTKLGEGYHHQGFSSSGYVVPLVRGLIGLDVDALRNTVTLNPHLPADWREVSLRHVAVGGRVYDFEIFQSDSVVRLDVKGGEPSAVTVLFNPTLPVGYRKTSAVTNGKNVELYTPPENVPPQAGVYTEQTDALVGVRQDLRSGDVLAIRVRPAPALLLPEVRPAPGAMNTMLKVLGQEYTSPKEGGGTLKVTVEGLHGMAYRLRMLHPERISSVDGGVLVADTCTISFDGKAQQGFTRRDVVFNLK